MNNRLVLGHDTLFTGDGEAITSHHAKVKPDTGFRGVVTLSELTTDGDLTREIMTENIQKDFLSQLYSHGTRWLGPWTNNPQVNERLQALELHLLYDPANKAETTKYRGLDGEGQLAAWARFTETPSDTSSHEGTKVPGKSGYRYDPATDEMVFEYTFHWDTAKSTRKGLAINKIALCTSRASDGSSDNIKYHSPRRFGGCYSATKHNNYDPDTFTTHGGNGDDNQDLSLNYDLINKDLDWGESNAETRNAHKICGNLWLRRQWRESSGAHFNLSFLDTSDNDGTVANTRKLSLNHETFNDTDFFTSNHLGTGFTTNKTGSELYVGAISKTTSTIRINKVDISGITATSNDTIISTATTLDIPLTHAPLRKDYMINPYLDVIMNSDGKIEIIYSREDHQKVILTLNTSMTAVESTQVVDFVAPWIQSFKVKNDLYVVLVSTGYRWGSSEGAPGHYQTLPYTADTYLRSETDKHFMLVQPSTGKAVTALNLFRSYEGSTSGHYYGISLLDDKTGSVLQVNMGSSTSSTPGWSSGCIWYVLGDYVPPAPYVASTRIPEYTRTANTIMQLSYEFRVKVPTITNDPFSLVEITKDQVMKHTMISSFGHRVGSKLYDRVEFPFSEKQYEFISKMHEGSSYLKFRLEYVSSVRPVTLNVYDQPVMADRDGIIKPIWINEFSGNDDIKVELVSGTLDTSPGHTNTWVRLNTIWDRDFIIQNTNANARTTIVRLSFRKTDDASITASYLVTLKLNPIAS